MASKKKTLLLERMGKHVLTHGLNQASLRPLAKAAKTSDRMLIYHFSNKQQLISELLLFLADDFLTRLDQAIYQKRFTSERKLILEVLSFLQSTAFRPYIAVWLDIVSASAQSSPNHKQTGQEMVNGFIAWIEARLPTTHIADKTAAMKMLVVIEGATVLESLGQTDMATQAVNAIYPA